MPKKKYKPKSGNEKPLKLKGNMDDLLKAMMKSPKPKRGKH